MEKIRLNRLSTSLKMLCTCYLLTILIGYGISLVQVFDRTQFDMAKTVLYYRGAETGDETGILLPQSFKTMLSVAHVHSMSQPMMFALIGLIFAFTSVAERTRIFFIVLLFAGSLVSNATPWLLRYSTPTAVWFFPLSQFAILVSVTVMTLVPLKEMWFKKTT